ELIKKCYPSSSPASSLIPKGYMGHIEKVVSHGGKVSSSSKPSFKALSIAIPRGIESERCVKEYLEQFFAKLDIRAKVELKDLNVIVEDWQSNKVHGYFAYVEGESDSTFFDHFLPDSSFPLG